MSAIVYSGIPLIPIPPWYQPWHSAASVSAMGIPIPETGSSFSPNPVKLITVNIWKFFIRSLNKVIQRLIQHSRTRVPSSSPGGTSIHLGASPYSNTASTPGNQQLSGIRCAWAGAFPKGALLSFRVRTDSTWCRTHPPEPSPSRSGHYQTHLLMHSINSNEIPERNCLPKLLRLEEIPKRLLGWKRFQNFC